MIKHNLPPKFEAWLKQLLGNRGIDLENPRALATKIMKLSDFYLENPGDHTPWNQDFAAEAYLAYFLPLNLMRLKFVWLEVSRHLPDDSWSELWDFGSGLGTTQWMLECEQAVKPRPLYALERAKEAIHLYKQSLDVASPQWTPHFTDKSSPGKNALGVFSYSFLEMQGSLPILEDFEHLLIVEPSTRECGRDLMGWRARLLDRGFTPLAPCTHTDACPLLTESRKDWCHMRMHFEGPKWWQHMEDFLPMHNRTLTYSYLLLSRSVQPSYFAHNARVIGDTLHENGKTKQMVCRNSKREFISWLHKTGSPPDIPHGSLISGLEMAEVKGNELRVVPGTLKWID